MKQIISFELAQQYPNHIIVPPVPSRKLIPPWFKKMKPMSVTKNDQNESLETVKKCYVELYGDQPVVTAIHAGLECGILKSKLGKLDVVSFGPTITGAHSPDERVLIPSVNKFWDLYKSVLQAI